MSPSSSSSLSSSSSFAPSVVVVSLFIAAIVLGFGIEAPSSTLRQVIHEAPPLNLLTPELAKLGIAINSSFFCGMQRDQSAIDNYMVRRLDGNVNEWGWCKQKPMLGANAILALVSLAVCKARRASVKKVPLHKDAIVGLRCYGSETELLYSVSDPLLIRDGSETESNNFVSDPLLIRDGLETEYNNSVSDPLLIRDGSEMEFCIPSLIRL
ncbi:hypothetical protein Scep_016248 [Stephania cephalantha]|uniref:Uncharacterized protein n=1 Tax=Stephania cephalantha TaxID=152367 RepID=A0AAP0IN47_9MAGN